MSNLRLVRCLICPVLLVALTSGCQNLHAYRPVVVQARDAETKQPISGAEVLVAYPLVESFPAPEQSTGTTGNDGVTRVRAAPYGNVGIQVTVAAKGYLSEEKDVSVAVLQAIQPAGWFEAVERRPVNFVVELYAGPQPTVELVVPTGYRGLVKVDLQARDDVACPPGQRLFSYEVPPSGILSSAGPVLLRRVFGANFTARYADGTPFPRQAADGALGLWWLRTEGNTQCFVVGTRDEYNAFHSTSGDDAAANHSPGGKGGGGKRGGRHGNSSSGGDPGSGGTNP
jgi:uncharacterized membrane protein YgcG